MLWLHVGQWKKNKPSCSPGERLPKLSATLLSALISIQVGRNARERVHTLQHFIPVVLWMWLYAGLELGLRACVMDLCDCLYDASDVYSSILLPPWLFFSVFSLVSKLLCRTTTCPAITGQSVQFRIQPASRSSPANHNYYYFMEQFNNVFIVQNVPCMLVLALWSIRSLTLGCWEDVAFPWYSQTLLSVVQYNLSLYILFSKNNFVFTPLLRALAGSVSLHAV